MIVTRTERPRLDLAGVATLAALIVLLHIATNLLTVYEFHRDEFLYLAMGKHLRLWRMDFPPGIALIANGSRALFGDSLTAIRAFPALGLGLLTKFSIGFIGLPIVVATVLTPQRRRLATRWPWVALLVGTRLAHSLGEKHESLQRSYKSTIFRF